MTDDDFLNDELDMMDQMEAEREAWEEVASRQRNSPVTANGWVRSGDPLAEEFSVFLASRCDWPLNDFGGDYPWDASVPSREDWDREVASFNRHMKTLVQE